MARGRIKNTDLSGRERLMATARRLFMERGTSNVGINEVTEQAGVARMTLYNNFASKEELVLAVYTEMTTEILEELRQLAGKGGTESERILAVFDAALRQAKGYGYRGCPMIHASFQVAEHRGPLHDLVRRYKQDLRDHLVSLLDERRPDPVAMAEKILLLLDGATTEAYLKAVSDPLAVGKAAASALLEIKLPRIPSVHGHTPKPARINSSGHRKQQLSMA
jgi:AcrR family transcriptional regulator